ncbi:ABC transporter substrate-binding protein [Methylocystis sp. FS]|uniref:extracellular solute-binding protein n=1 Tax=Methylocystis silviterrae TaxID=2743612 RepID=UPI0015831D36|nr:extracellular solute-binding protein [Methylocystis silviterrae]NUJ80712.1 ABC transporter substrate-binding protein [Methylocystis silviterrae]
MLSVGQAIGRMIAAAGFAALLHAVAVLLPAWALADKLSSAPVTHGLALYGEPALPKDFAHFPYANPDAPKGGALRLGRRGGFESLNPFNARFGVAPQLIIDNVLQSLMTRSQDEPYSLYPLIAQSIEIDDAREHVTFHLDPRARFSDKTPILASDVLFSFELLKSKGRPNHRVIFASVTSAVALNDHTVRFDLTGVKDREAPLILAAMPVLSKRATNVERFDELDMTIPLGSGPYVISESKAGSRLVLRRDPDYWARDIPSQRGLYNFDEIDLDYYRDGAALFEALKAGLIDYREETSAARWSTGYDFPAVRSGAVVKEALRPGRPTGMEGFVFNLRKAIFRDVRLREAIAMMYDFEWINANFYGRLYTRTESYFGESDYASTGRPASAAERGFLANFPGVVRDDILEGRWRPVQHDGSGRDRTVAKRAQTLLGAAGYVLVDGRLEKNGAPVVFEIMIRDRDEERLALNFAASLKRIGIEANPRLYDEVQYQRRRQRFEYDMMIGQWLASAVPGQEQLNRWTTESLNRKNSVNLAGAASPALDAAIDNLLASRTSEDSIWAARALDRILLSGFYFVPLQHVNAIWCAHRAAIRHPAHTPLFPMFPFGFTLESWWSEKADVR